MKPRIFLIALLALFGCVSGPGKFIAVTAKSVHTAMVDFYIVANTKGVSPDFSNRVESAYLTYQKSMAIATNAYALHGKEVSGSLGTSVETWLSASNDLWQAKVALLSLLNQK